MLKPERRVYLVAFLMDFAVITLTTVLPFFIYKQLGGGAAASGLIGGAQMALYAAMCLISSRFVGRTKNGMTWAYLGVVGFAVFSCLMLLSRNLYICGALTAVGVASLSLYWPALYSWMGAEPDLNIRARRMARFNIAWSLGFALGPLMAGPLYDYDYRLPFVAIVLIEAVIFCLLWTLPHEHAHFKKATAAMIESRAEHDRASERFLYIAWAANLMSNVISGVTRTVFPKKIEDLVSRGELRILWESAPPDMLTHNAATRYSWLAFLLSFTIAATFVWMGRNRVWEHRVWPLLVFQALAACAFWVLGHTNSLVIMGLCFMVVGVNCGLAFFAAVFYSIANPLHKHRRAAINEGAVGLGGFLGSVLFGLLANRYGINMPLTYTPLLVGVALLFQVALIPRHSPSPLGRGPG